MSINPKKVDKYSQIIALVYGISGLFVLPFILAFINRPWQSNDYLVAIFGVLYIFGLFIGLKWQRIGGLLSLILPVYHLIDIAIWQAGEELSEFHVYTLPSIILALILAIPVIFYLISWNAQRKQE